jgi:hypothetical protein
MASLSFITGCSVNDLELPGIQDVVRFERVERWDEEKMEIRA